MKCMHIYTIRAIHMNMKLFKNILNAANACHISLFDNVLLSLDFQRSAFLLHNLPS